jgi:hypothetical protein
MAGTIQGLAQPHTSECDLEKMYNDAGGTQAWWCNDHQMWAYRGYVKMTFTYCDGSEVDWTVNGVELGKDGKPLMP